MRPPGWAACWPSAETKEQARKTADADRLRDVHQMATEGLQMPTAIADAERENRYRNLLMRIEQASR